MTDRPFEDPHDCYVFGCEDGGGFAFLHGHYPVGPLGTVAGTGPLTPADFAFYRLAALSRDLCGNDAEASRVFLNAMIDGLADRYAVGGRS